MKTLVRALLACSFLAVTSAVAHADTINLSFTPDPTSAGKVAGTGYFTISGSVPTTGDVTFSQGADLTAVSFKVGVRTYTLANDLGTASVEFNNGVLAAITYDETQGSLTGGLAFSELSLTGNTYHLTSPGGVITQGTFAVSQAGTTPGDPTSIGATPEPSSIALLGTGLLGIAGAARRRFKA